MKNLVCFRFCNTTKQSSEFPEDLQVWYALLDDIVDQLEKSGLKCIKRRLCGSFCIYALLKIKNSVVAVVLGTMEKSEDSFQRSELWCHNWAPWWKTLFKRPSPDCGEELTDVCGRIEEIISSDPRYLDTQWHNRIEYFSRK